MNLNFGKWWKHFSIIFDIIEKIYICIFYVLNTNINDLPFNMQSFSPLRSLFNLIFLKNTITVNIISFIIHFHVTDS